VKPFKPLLACEADLSKIKYPVLASPKLDGIRCIIHPELGPVSRKLKPIPNKALREKLAKLPAWLDGELIAGPPTAKDVMQRTSSAVMSHESEDTENVTFYVFDAVSEGPYQTRYQCLGAEEWEDDEGPFGDPIAQLLHHETIYSAELLTMCEERHVTQGYEGIMLRDPKGIYKFGRSTVKEGILLKVKRFADMEGTVVGFVERMHNENEATKDALGHTKRSSAKAGKVGAGTLGALVLSIEGWGEHHVEVGTGFDDAQRARIWAAPQLYLGRLVTFKYQPSGSKDAPRFPVFKAFRDERDV
jgi:DNA ligase-1